jgi:L-fuconolactonase
LKLDAHQHFWKYTPNDYPWIDQPREIIARDFLPPDLEPLLRATGFDGCIAVQARQTLEETRWLLKLSETSPIIRGVVGWVDLRSAEVESQLREFAVQPLLVGIRHVVQDEVDDEFMLQSDFVRGIEVLAGFNLAYDILVFPKQLPAAIKLAQKFPEQRFVLDHIGKPPIKEGVFSPWREDIHELAHHGNVSCKVSGIVTEANWSTWEAADVAPYFDTVFESFDEDRLVFGSDWPVCLLGGSYRSIFQLARDYLRQFSARAQDKFFGLNAAQVYNLPVPAPR